MAKLTGRIITEKYAPGKRYNSFYEEQKHDRKIGNVVMVKILVYFIMPLRHNSKFFLKSVVLVA